MMRNVNLDMLRTLLMFFIVLFHAIIHGMIVNETNAVVDMMAFSDVVRSFVLQTILYLTSVSVNCFVLISGYFMVNKSLKLSRLTSIWLAAVFYGLVLLGIGAWDGYYELNVSSVIEQVLPVQFDNYWFVTQYMGVMLLSPFLNKTIAALDQRNYQKLLVVMGFLTLSFFQCGEAYFPYGYQYKLNGGFSLIWFVYVYFVGAYIRLYRPFQKFRHFGMLFILLSLAFAAYVNVIAFWREVIDDTPYKLGELTYNGFTFVLSCLLFLWTLNLKETGCRISHILAKCAPFVFGVYLIHDNFFLRDKIWHQWLHLNTVEALPQLLLTILGVSVAIFLVCLAIEYLRQSVFKLLRIDDRFVVVVRGLTDQCLDIANRFLSK